MDLEESAKLYKEGEQKTVPSLMRRHIIRLEPPVCSLALRAFGKYDYILKQELNSSGKQRKENEMEGLTE